MLSTANITYQQKPPLFSPFFFALRLLPHINTKLSSFLSPNHCRNFINEKFISDEGSGIFDDKISLKFLRICIQYPPDVKLKRRYRTEATGGIALWIVTVGLSCGKVMNVPWVCLESGFGVEHLAKSIRGCLNLPSCEDFMYSPKGNNAYGQQQQHPKPQSYEFSRTMKQAKVIFKNHIETSQSHLYIKESLKNTRPRDRVWEWKHDLSREESLELRQLEGIIMGVGLTTGRDKWVWGLEGNGSYSVGSLKRELQQRRYV
ncbi:hypothetical protein M8C21_028340, partial [Ambrosia artemisiifolia]